MGQSRFKWIIIYDNGSTETFEGTFDELWCNWSFGEPVAIVRVEFA